MDGMRLKTEYENAPDRRCVAVVPAFVHVIVSSDDSRPVNNKSQFGVQACCCMGIGTCGPFSQIRMDHLCKYWMVDEAERGKLRSFPKTRLAKLAQDTGLQHFSRLDTKLRELCRENIDENTRAMVYQSDVMCERYKTQPGQHELPLIPGEMQTDNAE